MYTALALIIIVGIVLAFFEEMDVRLKKAAIFVVLVVVLVALLQFLGVPTGPITKLR
jgi:hypothetical protein